MTLTYYKTTSTYEVCGSMEEDGDEVEYSPSCEQLELALATIICDEITEDLTNTQKSKLINKLKDFISDNDLLDILSENYYDYIWEYFRDIALSE